MKYHLALRHGVLAVSLGLATLTSWAGDDCDAPLNRWQTREAVRQMAAAQGWQIQRLKIDDGCYEIRGTDAQGRSFKAKIDPETLAVIKLKQRDRKADRRGDRKRERDSMHDSRVRGDTASPDKPLFTPGTTPRGQIE